MVIIFSVVSTFKNELASISMTYSSVAFDFINLFNSLRSCLSSHSPDTHFPSIKSIKSFSEKVSIIDIFYFYSSLFSCEYPDKFL